MGINNYNTMRIKITIVLLVLLGLSSCENEENYRFFDIGVENSFRFDREYQSSDDLMNFSVININDSRCPTDVVCVWEGKADVTIEVEGPLAGTIVLNTYDNLIDTIGNYSFELKEVLPHPISTETIELKDYRVTLKIEGI